MAFLIQEDGVVYDTQTDLSVLMVETPTWYAWLAHVTRFTFASQHGTFSARKERMAHGRGDQYWRAYRKSHGRLYRVYIGKSEHLTLDRLHATAQEIARRVEREEHAGTEPRQAKRTQSAHITPPVQPVTQQILQAQPATPLLHTKMHIPRFHHHLIARPHLIQQLHRSATRRLTLISAAAGSGKTTVLSEWAQYTTSPLAWLSLESEDNDPVRFWTYIVAALQHATSDSFAQAAQALRSHAPPAHQSALIELLNELDREARDIFIVLDDYHLIDTPAIHESFCFFLEHLPSQVHIFLATRSAPPFPFGRWRARNWLFELHSTDLRFSRAEAVAFFHETEHLILSEMEVTTVVERTEGWAAGLRLAALAIHGQPDVTHVVASFHGDHRFVENYLLDDILAQQPSPIRRFVLATAVLDRFTASLCDWMTGEGNGQAMLAFLVHAQLFLTILDGDGTWYRYHHLLTEAVRSRLQQEQPDRLRDLHRQASLWYERHALINEAVHHALAAEDFERAADLMEPQVDGMVQQNECAGLRQWLDRLPAQVLAQRPRLYLACAQVFIASGQIAQAEQYLDDVQRRENQESASIAVLQGKIAALRAHLFSVRGQAQESLLAAHQALALLPESEQAWRLQVVSTLGGAYLHAGQYQEAELAFREILTSYVQQHDFHRALATMHPLGQTQILMGRLDLVNTTYLQGLHLAAQHGLMQSAVVGHLHAGRGNLLYEWNDLSGAEEHLLAGIELARRGDNLIQTLECTLTLADVRQAQKRLSEALTILQQAQDLADQIGDPSFLNFVRRRPVYLWLAHNDVEAASRCARTSGLYQYGETQDVTALPSTFFLLIELLMLAHLYIGEGDLPRARKLLSRIEILLTTGQHVRRHIQWCVLQALAFQAEQRFTEAETTLAHAMELAEPMRYIRTFVDMGDAIIPLCATLLRGRPRASYSHGYLKQLLAAFGAPPSSEPACVEESPTQHVLTRQEFAVLRCLAAGHADREIARSLVVTEHTVKTHTRRIYRKLEVHSRTQAIAAARERGWI